MSNRIKIFQEKLRENQVDAYLILRSPNIKYYTKSLGGNYLYVPIDYEPTLFVSQLDANVTKDQAKNCRLETYTTPTMLKKLTDVIRVSRVLHLSFDDMSHDLLSKLRKRLPEIKFSQDTNPIWEMRRIKDAEEEKTMLKAGKLADTAMSALRAKIIGGVTEYELAAEASFEMMRNGAEAHAFDFTVASGYRSAYPHASVTARKIQHGDLIVVDIGASHLGYKSDITRTFIAGRPDKKQHEIYSAVLMAHESAFNEMKAGVACKSVDATARKIIEDLGYGEKFIHGLGHGVGLEIHEPPSVSSQSTESLVNGNVVSNEPGIYLHNFGGVRIEDTVLIKGDRPIRLTNYPRSIDDACF